MRLHRNNCAFATLTFNAQQRLASNFAAAGLSMITEILFLIALIKGFTCTRLKLYTYQRLGKLLLNTTYVTI